MRFSEKVGVDPTEAEWFDPVLTEDTPLYVDPFLVFEDQQSPFDDARELVADFFATASVLVERSKGDKDSPYWAKALRLLTFPEPKEFALGLSMGSPNGSGTGQDFATKMIDALEVMRAALARGIDSVDVFALFVPGLGVDRISDMLCNILKTRFITYTQQVCEDLAVPTTMVQVPHATWSAETGRWSSARMGLPRSPVTGQAVLLTPERFLQDIPQQVTAGGFWSWAEASMARDLRADLNIDVGESLTRARRTEAGRRLARREPTLAFSYLDEIAAQPHRPYDVRADPDLLVGWYESGREAGQALRALEGNIAQPQQADFCAWVATLVQRFRHAVEEMDAWRLLWNDDLTKHRQEKIVQALAGALWIDSCRAADVDITRESNAGRGPVDFKFSAGWQCRALLEVKLMDSPKLTRGAQAQLPQYMRSEQVQCGHYVCVGFTDADFRPERQQQIRATCQALSDEAGFNVTAHFIDARPKTSASKL